MPIITDLKARQVFDSRGIPTVEVELWLKDGGHGSFIAPSGASCGSKEALELRDNDPSRYNGRGVLKALGNIRGEISKAVLGFDFDQKSLDATLNALDSTENKSRLGANALLPVSGAFFKASAAQLKRPLYRANGYEGALLLPMPLINVINGGAHANNGLAIQEFMIVPKGAPNFSEALRMAAESFYALKSLLAARSMSTAVGDEGGFAPALRTNEEALNMLCEAFIKAGFSPGKDIAIALDVAASELFDPSSQSYTLDNKRMDKGTLLNWYCDLSRHFPICSIEDPFHENDYEAFSAMVKKLGSTLQIVGDDLFVTNERYIREGIEHHYANAVLIKMNQIGTISETLDAIKLSQDARFNAIISHRSGESEDTTIADLAVLTNAGQIKTGSMSRSERMAKYNRLLKIEEELGSAALWKTPQLFH